VKNGDRCTDRQAILFRLSNTFELTANTQRELRRAIHRLGDRRAAEPGFPCARASAESATGPDALTRVLPGINP